MKKLLLALFLTISSFAFAAQKNLFQRDIAMMDDLIETTTLQLDRQKIIREKLIAYRNLQERYLSENENSDLLYQMSQTANQLLTMIKENYLTHMFTTEFISEITVVAKPAAKNNLPTPQ